MDINFYNGEKSKVLGLMMASPEEFQTYAAAIADVPEGCVLTFRIRSVQVGRNPADKRREILIGATPVGQPLKLEGEDTAKPLQPTPPPQALEIPGNVKDATDEALEVMAVRNGVQVSDEWRRRSRPRREGEVAKAMAKRKQPAMA